MSELKTVDARQQQIIGNLIDFPGEIIGWLEVMSQGGTKDLTGAEVTALAQKIAIRFAEICGQELDVG